MDNWIQVIVKDGLVVGVTARGNVINYRTGECKRLYILPYRSYCYDTASDNDGAGYKERDYYRSLICLPYNHTLF